MHNFTIKSTHMQGIMDESQYNTVLLFFCVTWIIFSLLGIVSNVINIKTFIAMGLKDSVTVSFLALSVFDMTYVVTVFCFSISSAFSLVETAYYKHFPIQPYGIYIFLASIAILVNVPNTLTTTFLAVARCMCVAKPLHFKHLFTVKRTVVIMTGFAILAIAIYTPVLANMGMVERLDTKFNISRPMLWLSPYRDSVKNIVFTLLQMVLPVVTEVIVLACLAIMANRLRAASKFRQASHIPLYVTNVVNAKAKIESNQDTSGKFSGKDIRVVKQVALISLVYIICNTPKILTGAGDLIEPEFRLGKRYSYLVLCLNYVRMHFEIFNASINTFVYFAYNTKFRATLNLK
ncbi:unnamed protein product [Candidula unifasciata]|uniref:G-protein coupled receptors family 1 profile domain-containing protein n=1 Tax=Candidula unifasciata TaxID=100452 RepID=A0A8S3Z8H2_9EUPU|nr:unnamed protein product [Candidula unifasciata]